MVVFLIILQKLKLKTTNQNFLVVSCRFFVDSCFFLVLKKEGITDNEQPATNNQELHDNPIIIGYRDS
jgi:hypothetical protein